MIHSVYSLWGNLSKALVLTTLLCLASCSNSTTSTTQPSSSATVTASTGAKATVAQRVVALTSLSADIVHRLNPQKLVGVTGSTLLAKNAALNALPKVAEGRTPPNLEKIVALKPDLVIGAEGMHDQVLSKLKDMGIQTVATKLDRWTALADLTKTLATATGADPTALLKSYEGKFSPKSTKASSTLIIASEQPLLAPNSKSWAGDLLTQFGAKNIAADLQGKSPFAGYLTLSPEKVVTADPEVVILINAPGTDISKVKANPVLKGLKATKKNQIYVFDYYGLVNPGSLDAIDTATAQLQKIYQ
jgi:iron complex transport system substrate-binding protein